MLFDLKNILFRAYLKVVYPPEFTQEKSLRHQKKIFRNILNEISGTLLANNLKLNQVKTYQDFNKTIPITRFDFYAPYIELISSGEKKVMTSKPVKWFAKTAGTTSGKSKMVPITLQIMRQCHVRGSFFALSKIHQNNKQLNLLGHKNLLIPGGIYDTLASGIIVGDISAILVRNVPALYRAFYAPSIGVQISPHWESKLEATASEIVKEDIGTMSGVPTWLLSVFQKTKQKVEFDKLTDVWKNLQVYFHGGVSFEPYRKQFQDLVGKSDFVFYEVYNATEGFFGIQENLHSNNLLLLTDNFIFYEFIPLKNLHSGDERAIELSEVKTGDPYALVVTAPNGLVRYLVGDVIAFQTLNPYTFKITGRTQEYINAFGEDLMLNNVECALLKTNRELNTEISDFTVAPCYISIEKKGKIQFAIEFLKQPDDVSKYETLLDINLQTENSNYKQKRANDLALSVCEVICLPQGTFYKWLSSKNKLGGQNKVPRLVNGRNFIDELLSEAHK